MEKKIKAVVSKRALLQRINRDFARETPESKIEGTRRGTRNRRELGDFYLVNGEWVVECDVDLEQVGRKLGVLKAHEILAEGDEG